MAEESAANEPVKVKMTLRRAQLSVQGAEESRPATAAAVEAVEARWRAEDARQRAESRRRAVGAFCSWCLILLVPLGAAWFFLGEKLLPSDCAYPAVRDKVLALWNRHFGPPPPVPNVDPADLATEDARKALKNFVEVMFVVLDQPPPVQAAHGLEQKMRGSAGHRIFESVLSADAAYAKAVEKLEAMRSKNRALDERRAGKFGNEANRVFIEQYSARDLAAQEANVRRYESACAEARSRALARALETVKTTTAKWRGPVSRQTASDLVARLSAARAQRTTAAAH